MQSNNDILESQSNEFRKCPTRKLCPLRDICAVPNRESARLVYPKTITVERGDLLWGTHYAEDRVLVFKKGVFLSVGYSNQGGEVPFCLYGAGNSVGFSDMFTAEDIRNSYHVRALLSGEVCSFSASVIKRELDKFPDSYVQALAVSTLTSQCAGAFSVSMIKHQKSVTDRIVALLYCLYDLTSRVGASQTEFNITHEDISMIIGADRTTTTRALKKIGADNVVEVKYGVVKLLPESLSDPLKKQEYHTNFVLLEDNTTNGEASKNGHATTDFGTFCKMI